MTWLEVFAIAFGVVMPVIMVAVILYLVFVEP